MKLIKDTDQILRKNQEISDEKAEEAIKTTFITNVTTSSISYVHG